MQFPFVDLETEADNLVTASVSKATAIIYKRCAERYLSFCIMVGLPCWGRKSGQAFELWVTSLSKQGLSHGTIMSHVSAVRHHSREKGLRLMSETDRLNLILRGIKARTAKVSTKKVPVSSGHLRRLNQAAVMLGPLEALRFRVMIAVAFYGFLRPSEFCKTKAGHHLRRKDVHLYKSNKVGFLNLNSYKHSTKSATVKLCDAYSKDLKPVRLLRKYFDKNQLNSNGPLFNVTLGEFRLTLAQVCETAQIKSKLSPHCFRHGGATWASKRGWSDSRIKAHGRWKSSAYISYIKPY